MFSKILQYNTLKVIGTIVSIALFTSCSGFLDVDPTTELPDIKTAQEANAALNGVYARMKTSYYYGADVITYGDVRGDDMATTSVGDRTTSAYQFGNQSPLNYTNVGYFWQYMYDELNRINSILSKIEAGAISANTESDKTKLNNIETQLYALRALASFNLARIHAKPYTLAPTSLGIVIANRVIDKNEEPVRSTVKETYDFIVNDLNKAIDSGYLSSSKSTGYINIWSAKSLLARVYLSMGEWDKAYALSVDVINNGGYSLISNSEYVDSWSKTETSESIFEIISLPTDNADREGIGYLMKPRTSETKGYGAISVSDEFVTLMREDTTDVRWKLLQQGDTNIHSYLAKYPGQSGNIYVNNARVVRLSDVYLMAAEAGVKSGKSDASKYLNAIRKRANPNVADVVATEDLVAKERRKELVGEGARYFDILRNLGTGSVTRTGITSYPVTSTMMPIINWGNNDAYRLIMPIPSSETDVNKKIQQNPGY